MEWRTSRFLLLHKRYIPFLKNLMTTRIKTQFKQLISSLLDIM